MMKIYKRFTKDVGLVTISDVAMKLRPIIFLPIITKALGASDYGVYTTIFITFAFLAPFADLRLNAAFVRFCSGEKDKKKVSRSFSTLSIFALLLSIGIAAVLFMFSGALAETVFGAPGSGDIIAIASLFFPLFVLRNLIVGYFRSQRKMFLYSLFRISFVMAPIALASIFILMGMGLAEVMLAYIITYLIVLPIFLILILKDIGISFPDFSIIAPYAAFGAPLILVALSAEVLNMGDRYVLGFFIDAAAVGVYAASYNLGKLLVFLLNPITTALLSPLSQAYDAGKMNEVKTYLNYSVRYFLLLSIPAIIGLTLLAPQVIRSLTTKEFVTDGAAITPIIALSIFFFGLYSITTQVFLLVKKTRQNAKFVGATAIANIILNIILIPYIGLMGAAISTLFSYLALWLLTHLQTRKYIRITYDLIFTAKCLFASAPMGVFVWIIAPRGWFNILITVLVAVGIYFAVMYALGAFRKGELRFFKSFLKEEEAIANLPLKA